MTRFVARLFPRMLVLVALGVLGACSSFDPKWEAAGKATGPDQPTRWEGRWTSAGHKTKSGEVEGGRLRAVLTPQVLAPKLASGAPVASGGGARPTLRADFHANWKVFATNYTLLLTPVPGSRTDYRGTHDLPAMFGGTYRYTARVKGDRFTATYDSSYDRGTFELTRVR